MLQSNRTPYWGGLMKFLVRSVVLAAAPASGGQNEGGRAPMTPAPTHPGLDHDRGKEGWNQRLRPLGADDPEGGGGRKFPGDYLQGKTVAIGHDKTAYGKGIADETM